MIFRKFKALFIFIAIIISQLICSVNMNAQMPTCDKMWSHYNQAKIHQMCFLTDKKWFMVGSFSTVLVTENAGQSWEKLDTRDYFPYIDIDFFDDKEGIITRYAFIPFSPPLGACFVRTTDGGKTWQPMPTPFLPTQLDVIDGQSAYASTWNGGVYHTTNRGKNWNLAKIESSLIKTIHFASKEIGWAYTQTNIYRTIDGGKTWEKWEVPQFLKNGSNIPFPIVLSKDKTTLWVLNIGTKQLGRSTDKGTTWTVTEVPDYTYQMIPLDNTKALFVYQDALYLSENGGKNWQKKTAIDGSASVNLFFHNEKRGYYVGSRTQASGTPFGSNSRTIVETKDGGETWQSISTSGDVVALNMINGKQCYASTSDGLLKTEDGGITWQKIFYKEGVIFSKIKVLDDNHIIAVSSSQQKDIGGIYFSRDKGKTWSVSPILDPVFQYAMHNGYFIDTMRWIAAYKDSLLITANSGQTYQPFNTPTDSLSYFSEDIAHVEGNTFILLRKSNSTSSVPSRIYKTTNGGNTWQLVQKFETNGLTDAHRIYFKNSKVGFIVNRESGFSFELGNDQVLRTIDGGNTWQALKVKIPDIPETRYYFNGFDYFDENNFALTIGRNPSYCYLTKDGGKTWIPTQYLHPYVKYKKGTAINYINKDSLYVAGSFEAYFNLITALKKPAMPTGLQGDTVVKLGDVSLYTALYQASDDNFKWVLESGGSVVYSRIDTMVVRWNKIGYHRIKLLSLNDCGDSEPFYFTIRVEDSISLSNKLKTITSIFPNPSDGLLKLRVPEFKQVTSIQVNDLMGRQIYLLDHLNWSNGTFDINIPDIVSGLYILVVQLSDGKDVYKIMLNK